MLTNDHVLLKQAPSQETGERAEQGRSVPTSRERNAVGVQGTVAVDVEGGVVDGLRSMVDHALALALERISLPTSVQ